MNYPNRWAKLAIADCPNIVEVLYSTMKFKYKGKESTTRQTSNYYRSSHANDGRNHEGTYNHIDTICT